MEARGLDPGLPCSLPFQVSGSQEIMLCQGHTAPHAHLVVSRESPVDSPAPKFPSHTPDLASSSEILCLETTLIFLSPTPILSP